MAKRRPRASYLTKDRWTASEARAALAAVRASGLSARAFAIREGLVAQRLYWWQQRLGSTRPAAAVSAPAFVELKPRGPDPVEVVLRSGRVLRVSPAIDPSSLARLVEALERSAPC